MERGLSLVECVSVKLLVRRVVVVGCCELRVDSIVVHISKQMTAPIV